MKPILTKRIYEPVHRDDGVRVLVDRLWPRGISKNAVSIDYWAKELAPSSELRKWYGHDVSKWEEFRSRYREELAANPALREFVLKYQGGEVLTLLFAAKDVRFNNAIVLQEYLKELWKC